MTALFYTMTWKRIGAELSSDPMQLNTQMRHYTVKS